MKQLPLITSSCRELFDTCIAPLKTNAMIAGIQISLFDDLTKPLSVEKIAKIRNFDPAMTKEFLNLLVASGLLYRENDAYLNTPVTDLYLVRGKPTYIGDLLASQEEGYRQFSADEFAKRVRNGYIPPPEDEDLRSADCWEQHAKNMANWERSGTAQVVAEIISSLPEFPSMKKMLDLGGGPGLIGIGVTLKNLSISGVIFDQPTVTPVTRTYIEEYELQSRLHVMSGNYNFDDFGTGYDLIIACFTLNFAPSKDEIVKRIYSALNPGGIFFSLHDGMYNGGAEPGEFVLVNVPCNFCGYILSMDKGVIADAMIHAGFRSIHSKSVVLDFGIADLDIGRK